jgi:ribose 5-phosphate isomerase RpiB
MPVLIASDLGCERMKQYTMQLLKNNNCDVFDMGFVSESNISKIGEVVNSYPNWTAIVFCKNASSLSILLNNYTNVRSIVAHTDEHDIFMARNKYQANIMCFPVECGEKLNDLVGTFLTAQVK